MVKNLTDEQRTCIKDFLMKFSDDMIIQHGKLAEAASTWNVTTRTISTIWKRIKEQEKAGSRINVDSKRKGKKSGPKMVIDIDRVKAIEPAERNTQEAFAESYGCSKTTVFKWVKKGLLRSHTNAIHPQLSADHKLFRLKFSLGALCFDRLLGVVKFKSMFTVIHIDEKWFDMKFIKERYILLPGEVEPYRACTSKRFITKVMFMCAVARPCFGENGEVLFDGKIGIFPFTEMVAAQRSSRNRPAGTLEIKPVNKVNREVTKDCLINKIVPAIKSKWPPNANRNIIIQQDNTTPHISPTDTDFIAAATSDGFNIQLKFQPAMSPDLNINDLGFFRAIQSLQIRSRARTVAELLQAVEDAYQKLEPTTLNKVFISLQAVMIEIMKRKGHNDFPLPHMGKAALERRGQLPIDLEVDEVLVRECIDYLLYLGQQVGNDTLMEDLGYNN